METGLTTKIATREVRLRQWQEIFHDRRESGMTVKDYCQSHGITKDSYYYWQKVAREAAISEAVPVFAELRPELNRQEAFYTELTIRIGEAIISANRETPEALLQKAVRAIGHAE